MRPTNQKQLNETSSQSAAMNPHDHAPLVAVSTPEAAETMISEGSPLHPPADHADVEVNAEADAETPSVVAEFPRWSVQEQGLTAEFKFPSYLAGIDFVRQVAEIAEGMNHHPDIWVGWRKVRLAVMTHSKQAITSLDEEFVRKVEAL